ncbi:hypothetical protein [Flavobacterium granuli]|uniref:Uncharacterized protein n=1 Tax=Flavobacterium granuli TaxID=280093 RepID=A0A1M5IU26_9FLAO|nr:hypothetical protein [Flavobacterium granuli]PRZ28107.1 hypothetical protein BC624_101394 [Flavobacterium granuli]SHG31675.1 hypothetical protein SAMN05443373_101394 [Flavobacterium granuli]
MKAYIIVFLFLGLTNLSYSQNKTELDPSDGNISIENLPAVVIKSVGDDFSVYITDRNSDPKVRKLQDRFIAYDLGKNLEGYETYLVYMEIKGGALTATYDEKGKLIRVVENYVNVKLPAKVFYSVYKNFPGWEIINDKYLYSQENGDILKKEYNLKIKKGNETKRLTVRPNGEIISGM